MVFVMRFRSIGGLLDNWCHTFYDGINSLGFPFRINLNIVKDHIPSFWPSWKFSVKSRNMDKDLFLAFLWCDESKTFIIKPFIQNAF